MLEYITLETPQTAASTPQTLLVVSICGPPAAISCSYRDTGVPCSVVDGSHGDEDVTQSPPAPGQRGQAEDETEVVIRSQWQPGEGVTQLAAHSIADGKRSGALHGDFCEEGTGAVAQSLPQFWRAGDVGSIRTTAGLPNSMAEFDDRLTVTV